jgi:hypothetical protein
MPHPGYHKRLIVVAVAVALRRGDVAVLLIVVLDPRRRLLFDLSSLLVLASRCSLPVPPISIPPDRIDAARR